MSFQKTEIKDTVVEHLPKGWTKITLKEVCSKIGSGITPRGGANVYISEGTALIRSQNVLNNCFSGDGLAYINENIAKEMENVALEERDVLLNITGDSVARCCTVSKNVLPARVNQHVSIVRPNQKEIDPIFLKYYLTSPKMQKYMLSLAESGGTRNALTKGMIQDFVIPKPEIDEQKAIANFLMSLDSKIELNQRMNRTLQAIGDALFKRWFVDFEFPNQEGKPYRSTDGKMQYNQELGCEIPDKFKVGTIYELCDIIYGFPFASKYFNSNNEGIPLIRIRDLKTSNPDFFTIEKKDPRMTLVKQGDIIAGMDAEFTPWIWLGDTGYLNQRLCMFKPRAQKNVHEFLVYQIVKPLLKKEEKAKVGTTVIHLAKSDIERWRVIIPDNDNLALFSDLIKPFFERLIVNSQQIRASTQLRDLLLPKFMSGKIRLPINISDLEVT